MEDNSKNYFTIKKLLFLLVPILILALSLFSINREFAAYLMGILLAFLPILIFQINAEVKAKDEKLNNKIVLPEPIANWHRPSFYNIFSGIASYFGIAYLISYVLILLFKVVKNDLDVSGTFMLSDIFSKKTSEFGIAVIISFALGTLISGFFLGKFFKTFDKPLLYCAIVAFLAKILDSTLLLLSHSLDKELVMITYLSSFFNVAICLFGATVAIYSSQKRTTSLRNLKASFWVLIFACVFGYLFLLIIDYRDKSPSFNNLPSDLSLITVTNPRIDIQDKSRNISKWRTSTLAKCGDSLLFRVYIHNTSNFLAKDVRVQIALSKINNIIIANATLICANSNAIHSQAVYIQIDTTEYEIEPVACNWYPNGTVDPCQFPNDQNELDIRTLNGINLGDIVSERYKDPVCNITYGIKVLHKIKEPNLIRSSAKVISY
jgi:hypothetical protein